MWYESIEFFPPLFYENFCFLQVVKDFTIESFVCQLSIEWFIVVVLPWATWFNEKIFHFKLFEPSSDYLCCKFRSIIRSDMTGQSSLTAYDWFASLHEQEVDEFYGSHNDQNHTLVQWFAQLVSHWIHCADVRIFGCPGVVWTKDRLFAQIHCISPWPVQSPCVYSQGL